MLSTLKNGLLGRPLKSGAEGEGGLLGKCSLATPSSDALSLRLMVQSKLVLVLMTVFSGSHLVVHSDWDQALSS